MFESVKRILNQFQSLSPRQTSVRRQRNRGVCLEILEQRELLSADFQLVKDINPLFSPDGSSPSEYVAVGAKVYFSASTNLGTELWATDGTAAGTKIVKDILEGGASSSPSNLTSFNGAVYFAANGGTNNSGLWKSDGTAAGTVFVKGISRFSTVRFTTVGSTLYFAAESNNKGIELWKSDGTTAGTSMVKDIDDGTHQDFYFDPFFFDPIIYTAPNSSSPAELTNVDGTLYFTATDGTAGRELWKSNGTEAGTILVKDLAVGTHEEYQYLPFGSSYTKVVQNGSSPAELINFGGTLYFTADDGSTGRELWRTDGGAASTTIVKDAVSGAGSSAPGGLTNVNGVMYFSADDGVSGRELWKSNGTPAGTSLVSNIRSGSDGSFPYNLTNVGGVLYFSANDGGSGVELWKSNGTPTGTTLVSNIRSGVDSSYPNRLTNVGGVLYFSADDGLSGEELWKSSGTAAGTILVKNIQVGSGGSSPNRLANINGLLYFSADDGPSGIELYISNGTSAGTALINIEPENGIDSQPFGFANTNGNLYFTANDGTHGRELWKSDGTVSGTVMVKDIVGGINGSDPGYLTSVGEIVYFTASDGINGAELWKTDGTAAGTMMVKNLRAGADGSYPGNLTNVGGVLYFTANDGTNGTELWKSDGTPAGTFIVKDIVSGSGNANPAQLANHAGVLYFTANGSEIWKSNGTAVGTTLVKEIGSEGGAKATGMGGLLFFLAGSFNSQELWKTDGTPAGTVLVKNLGEPSFFGSAPRELINVGGILYFNSFTPTNGEELWKSDGTESGTVLVKDIYEGDYFDFVNFGTQPNSASPQSLTNVDGTLYFVASDGTSGKDVWKSDGTSANTVKVKDVEGYSNGLHAVGDRLFASLFTEAYGAELHIANPVGTSGNDVFTLSYSVLGAKQEVTVTLSTDGGQVSTIGTFSTNIPLSLDGLGGTDSVRVVGTNGADTISVNSSTSLTVNGTSLILKSIENRTLAGAGGSDVYRFDADTPLGLWSLDEAGGGIDTVDFSLTTTAGLSMNMAFGGVQAVHGTNLSLSLGSGVTLENVIGGSGADNLIGNSLSNTLRGGPGDDKLNGAAGSDFLFGGINNDTYIFGAASVAEADQVTENVNEGIDMLNFAFLTTSVALNMAANSVQPVHANRTLKLNSPITFENAIGGSGADNLIGNSLNNTLTGGPGNDTLNGSGGSDFLLGGANNDTYLFGPASVAEADQVAENLNEGTDTLNFATLTTNIVVNLGANSVQALHLNRTLKLNSPITFENFTGGSGADNLIGNSLSNILTGGPGDDTLNGAAGSDILVGGANNDTYLFGAATAAEADQVIENTNDGIDLLNFAYLTTDVALNLGATAIQPVHLNRTLKLNSVSTFENAMGGTGSDTLLGNVLANRLTGGNGSNILVGLEGADILVAGTGRDILIGGLGLDVLNGGAGDDILISGRTASDTSLGNLNTIRTQWISGNAYATRIANLRVGVGNPLVSLKTTINVLNDGGEDDVMVGGTDTDWFFRALDDVITDLVTGELIDVL
jgi:ELWxxDGT repeat protein